MNANHILTRWERVKPVFAGRSFKPLMIWVIALHAARDPISAPELQEKLNCSLSHAAGVLRFLAANDLVTLHSKVHIHGKPRRLWQATPKLYDALGLEPMTTTNQGGKKA